MSVEQTITDVIVATLSIKPEEVKLDQSLYDSLGMDSTELVDLKVALEKKFSIKFSAEEITKSSTPKDIAALIAKKGAVN